MDYLGTLIINNKLGLLLLNFYIITKRRNIYQRV